MGRMVVAESSIQDGIAETFKNSSSGLGLVIGQLTSQRDYVVHLARTPSEGEESKTPITLEAADDNWIATHARQVMRMIPGGLGIIGVFAYGTPDAIQKAQMMLRKAVFAVHKVQLREEYIGKATDEAMTDRVVVQICSVTKKITCRTFDVSDPKCAIKPADWKTQSFVDKWARIETTFYLASSFSVSKESMSRSVETQMKNGLRPVMDSILNSLATIDGSLKDQDELLDHSPTGGGGGGKKKKQQDSVDRDKTFVVSLLESPIVRNYTEEPTQEICGASMKFRGAIIGLAYVHSKASVREAIMSIKTDLMRSIQARYELLCEDLLQSEEENDKVVIYEMPIRVFSPVPGLALNFCDYLFPEEELQYSISRFSEFIGVQTEENQMVLDKERFPQEEELQQRDFPSSLEEPQQPQSEVSAVRKASSLVVIGLSGAVAALAAAVSYIYLGDQ